MNAAATTTLEDAMREIAVLRKRVADLESASGLFADDRELDSSKGNPPVKFSPKQWRGNDFKGARLADCPPDFLDAYATALAQCAARPRPGKEQYAEYDRKDAARARGWARRLRAEGVCDGVAPEREKPAFGGKPSFGGSSGFGGATPSFGGSSFAPSAAPDFGGKPPGPASEPETASSGDFDHGGGFGDFDDGGFR